MSRFDSRKKKKKKARRWLAGNLLVLQSLAEPRRPVCRRYRLLGNPGRSREECLVPPHTPPREGWRSRRGGARWQPLYRDKRIGLCVCVSPHFGIEGGGFHLYFLPRFLKNSCSQSGLKTEGALFNVKNLWICILFFIPCLTTFLTHFNSSVQIGVFRLLLLPISRLKVRLYFF